MEAKAILRNTPTSPMKMRLLADLIRREKVDKALSILKHHPQHSAKPLYKLLLSASSNWTNKQGNENGNVENLYIKEIFVDGGAVIKRVRPAPQGRGYKIRKRSNHVTLIVDSY
ncbi:MAG: 50S ribosomal protein L22 [Alphaproteobacteria bacterium]|nr:50S ribosomal protein L22 [Alphaproteobacteria bacterium]